MHSNGLLHCDIRPKNILIDEYGILKISDFKLARKIPKSPVGVQPMENRGTAAYMAPELFLSTGVHSFATDFWALGCTLYQLRKGVLPFGDIENADHIKLLHIIKTSHPFQEVTSHTNDAKENITVSDNLVDLVSWLLEKLPIHRCNWYVHTY